MANQFTLVDNNYNEQEDWVTCQWSYLEPTQEEPWDFNDNQMQAITNFLNKVYLEHQYRKQNGQLISQNHEKETEQQLQTRNFLADKIVKTYTKLGIPEHLIRTFLQATQATTSELARMNITCTELVEAKTLKEQLAICKFDSK